MSVGFPPIDRRTANDPFGCELVDEGCHLLGDCIDDEGVHFWGRAWRLPSEGSLKEGANLLKEPSSQVGYRSEVGVFIPSEFA